MINMKMTKNRRLIKNILAQANKPLTAQEIHQRAQVDGQSMWLSTVYRNLETFEKARLVVKTQIPGLDEDFYILNQGDHKHFVICKSCKTILAHVPCPMDYYRESLEVQDLDLVDHQFVLYAYCKSCQ